MKTSVIDNTRGVGILSVPTDMVRVSPSHFAWFIRSIANPRIIPHSNGTAYFQDSTMVAAKFTNDQHYVKVKR